MVLPGNFASQIPLIIIARSRPSAKWLENVVQAAHAGAEVEGVRLSLVDDLSFSGWSLERVSDYVAREYGQDISPFASRSFAAVDDISEGSNSLLVVSLDPASFGQKGQAKIEGTIRVGPEYGVDMPALFHQDIRGIGTFIPAAEETDGILRREPVPQVDVDSRVTMVLGRGEGQQRD